MKKSSKRMFCALAVAAVMCLSASCGNSGSTQSEMSEEVSSGETQSDGNVVYNQDLSMSQEEGVGTSTSVENGDGSQTGTADGRVSNAEKQGQKLIKNVTICAETKEYDKLMASLDAKINQLNGYIESSEEDQYGGKDRRCCTVTVRIPCDSLDSFLAVISESTNVLSKNVSTEDVTLTYVDMESHIKALRTEEETLLGLLEKAEKLSDVITLQDELTDVRYQIESYESQLRTYDNLVQYSTVSLTVEEVERETTVSEKKSFLSEIRSGLSDNLYSVGQVIRSLAIWLIVSLPYFVVIGAAVAVVVFVIRKIKKRHRKKHENEKNEK